MRIGVKAVGGVPVPAADGRVDVSRLPGHDEGCKPTLVLPRSRACKESCVRNVDWVDPSTILPYGDSRMDAALQRKAELLASEIATQAQTLDDLNGLVRTLMKAALERMLDT